MISNTSGPTVVGSHGASAGLKIFWGLALVLLLWHGNRAPAWAWASLGPDGAQVQVLAVAPTDPSVVYAGLANGVRKSLDGGETWLDIIRVPNTEVPLPEGDFLTVHWRELF